MLKFSVRIPLFILIALSACENQQLQISEPQKPTENTVANMSDETTYRPVNIHLEMPDGDAVANDAEIRIYGNISEFKPSYRIIAAPNPFVKIDQKNEKFEGYYRLNIGNNDIVLKIVDIENGNALVASTSLSLRHVPNSPAIGFIPHDNGGEIRVTDEDSKIYGASVAFAPNTFSHDVWARLEHYPDQTPNLPEGYVAIGPSVSMFPIGEPLAEAALLTIPYSTALFPSETSSKDVKTLALADQGWIELPSQAKGEMSVDIPINELIYNPYIAVIKNPAE